MEADAISTPKVRRAAKSAARKGPSKLSAVALLAGALVFPFRGGSAIPTRVTASCNPDNFVSAAFAHLNTHNIDFPVLKPNATLEDINKWFAELRDAHKLLKKMFDDAADSNLTRSNPRWASVEDGSDFSTGAAPQASAPASPESQGVYVLKARGDYYTPLPRPEGSKKLVFAGTIERSEFQQNERNEVYDFNP